MNIAVLLARHRRLLALLAASVLVHTLVIGWIAAAAKREAAGHAGLHGLPISLRLQAAAPPQAPASSPASAPAAARPAVRANAAASTAHATPATPPAPAALASAVAGAAPAPATAGGDGDGPVQMPGRYRVRMPPSATLSYSVTSTSRGGGATPPGAAQLAWRTDGDRYTLRSTGVTGTLASVGTSGDAGIVPLSATEQRADGSVATTTFDPASGRIGFSASARSYPINTGTQDRASLLMQLAGIGLGEPDQVKDVIDIYVGGAGDARIVRFQVLGMEDVESALGTLASMHLAQLVRPGEPRLEVWLAPGHNWYPVQLRVTAPDGTASTQVVTRIELDAGAG